MTKEKRELGWKNLFAARSPHSSLGRLDLPERCTSHHATI